ncbi:alpha-amylase family glycosyl hydrolase [Galbibacter mesophilus]|uniref:alpha-amylase family glycosyl hydrolase n=1 Tax=Galbibacter mesophilus TaxID=379069 RepID=UPI00191D084E|nr:alpha-amylase family glycosyl hydrolase [Galbibacter mesophilus]MCM5663890.1 alpha-amylase family glycosyl hydrolase [Galbibacter mesophilus]
MQAQVLSFKEGTFTTPKWALGQPIYEADITRVTPEGTFKAFEKQLPRLKELGVGIIWLMPIHQRGSFRIKPEIIDSLGGAPIPVPKKYRIKGKPTSPYNIHDHYSINPNYGTKKDLKSLVDKAHSLGMYIILDWVINHTSWDHVLIDEHPEFYKRNEKGYVMYVDPWQDIAQLDHDKPETREYMINMTKYWVEEFDLDGFRTDVADRVPAVFWNDLREELNKIKPVFLLAEGFEPINHPSHDASYDWFLSTAFWSVKEGKRNVEVLDGVLAREQAMYPEGFLKMRHATNHDTQSSGFGWPGYAKYCDKVFDFEYFDDVPLGKKFGKGLKGFMVLATTLPNSVPMLWNGQEQGILQRTPGTIQWENNEWTSFYTKLLQIYREQPLLIHGDYQRVNTVKHDPKVFSFIRSKENETILVVVNISEENRTVAFDEEKINFSEEVINLFTEEVEKLDYSELKLDAWDFKIYKLQ